MNIEQNIEQRLQILKSACVLLVVTLCFIFLALFKLVQNEILNSLFFGILAYVTEKCAGILHKEYKLLSNTEEKNHE